MSYKGKTRNNILWLALAGQSNEKLKDKVYFPYIL